MRWRRPIVTFTLGAACRGASKPSPGRVMLGACAGVCEAGGGRARIGACWDWPRGGEGAGGRSPWLDSLAPGPREAVGGRRVIRLGEGVRGGFPARLTLGARRPIAAIGSLRRAQGGVWRASRIEAAGFCRPLPAMPLTDVPCGPKADRRVRLGAWRTLRIEAKLDCGRDPNLDGPESTLRRH
jgi:hypothetical protein